MTCKTKIPLGQKGQVNACPFVRRKKDVFDLEKYGAEIEKYEVLQIVPFQPDDKKLVAQDLTLEQANDLAEKNKNYMIRPMI